MKKFLAIAALAAGLAGLTGKALAYTVPGNPTDVEVYAQMASTLEITIMTATVYDFGTFTTNEQKVSDGGALPNGFVIRNTGGGLTQTYQLNAQSSANWTLFPGTGMPGLNQFAIDALFQSGAAPAIGDFDDTTDRLPLGTPAFAAFIEADGTNMAGAGQTGMGVALSADVNLYLRFTAPSTTGSTARQRVQVNINAVAP